ncbi:hypothetical protein [Agromyces sp. Soil535]|uniref:hypothetical protein n=1 Tax=Agromyces sp. Soil535 TaxID=1736390 RepID=UPI000AF8A34D|nr:hypothetical protein [Agromyces sp. Soil535]
MSDERASRGIDPMFDPRYQRGYIPDAAGRPAAVPTPIDDVPAASRDATAPHDETPPAPSPAETPDAAEPSPTDPWFIAAWAFAGLAVVGGLLILWGSVSGDNVFGPENEPEEWLQFSAWNVAPVLIGGGLIGIVGLLVWTGARHARRRGVAGIGRLLRNPAVLTLAALAVVASVATVWAIGASIEVRLQFLPGADATEEQLAELRLVAIANAIPAPATLTAVFAVLGILLVGATSSDLGRTRRSVLFWKDG